MIRYVEVLLAMGGAAIACAYVWAVEIAPAWRCTTHQDHGLPWGVVIVVTAMVLPMTLGRATAGQIWTRLMGRLPGRRAK